MEIQLVQIFDVDGYLLRMSKKHKSSFVPRKGDFISDPAFEDDVHEVMQVNLDLDSQTCTVVLATIKMANDYTDVTREVEENYGPHNWFRF